MPISGMILLKDGTLAPATGGTAVTFQPDGQQVANGVHVVDTSVTDTRVQTNITIKNRPSSYNNATGEFTKDKKSIVIVEPVILASGKLAYNLFRIEREVHPECSVGQRLNSLAAQCMQDADLANFWNYGSLG